MRDPKINQRINHKYNHMQNRPFTSNWWHGHPGHRPGRYPWCRPGGHFHANHWWRCATASAVTGWIVGTAWNNPIYYSYGSGGNVYYDDDTVYVDGEPYCSSEEYYDQAETIASSVPEMTDEQAEQVEWLPLGVFAVTQDGVGDNNLVLQLAVSKDGMIAGTLINETTETTQAVEGMVDKKTQRAAWAPVDGKNKDVVMETSIYNLTEDQTTALVHFGPDKVQQWILVRLDDPEADAQAAPAGGGTS